MSDKGKLELSEIKKKVEGAYQYFESNYERFYKFKNFVFRTALTAADVTTLEELHKPIIEFNTGEAYLSRLLGEFATQEPGVKVTAQEGLRSAELTDDLLMTIDAIQAHLRYLVADSTTDNLQYNIYNDTTGGGFSVMRVHTDYVHPRSFDQKIYIDRVFDPTLCGFDPLARASHKGDGNYCFEMSPYSEVDFIAEFGKDALKDVKFTRSSSMNSFSWSYTNGQDEKILLVVDFYVKRKVRETLVRLADNSVGTLKQYNQKVKEAEENGELMVPPAIIDRRVTVIETIDLYRVCENQILDYMETDYMLFPLIFVDGNSVMLRESANGEAYQMTRPYLYHTEGIQRLRNFAGQTIGQQLQNMLQHKIKVPLQAIPTEGDYLEAYKNVQVASTLVYNQYSAEDPTIRFDPPTEIQQTSPPPILESTFSGADRIMQAVLGNYDAVLGMNTDVSGRAIQAGSIQSSLSADPYLVNYMKGLNRALEVVVSLIPKYYKTPRTIPVLDEDKKRAYVSINDEEDENSINFQYDPSILQVRVEAGVNNSIQKQISLETITKLAASNEGFGAFVNQKCLPIIVDNLEINGSEQLKALAQEWVQEQAAAAEEAKEREANTPNPVEIEAQTLLQIEQMKSQMKEMQMQADLAVKTAELAIEKQKTEIEEIKALAMIGAKQTENMIKQERLDAEQARTAVELLKDVSEAQAEGLMEENNG